MSEAVLTLTEGMPERALAVGEDLFDNDEPYVAVLVTGHLRVSRDGAELARISAPGSFVGELSGLLGTRRTASVVAEEPTVLRIIGDPDAFFHEHPSLGLELSRQLAGRLHRLNSYLVDLRNQYADRDDHLGMVDSVLARIATRPPVEIEPGSTRSPDY